MNRKTAETALSIHRLPRKKCYESLLPGSHSLVSSFLASVHRMHIIGRNIFAPKRMMIAGRPWWQYRNRPEVGVLNTRRRTCLRFGPPKALNIPFLSHSINDSQTLTRVCDPRIIRLGEAN